LPPSQVVKKNFLHIMSLSTQVVKHLFHVFQGFLRFF
jgi:hypothetical protein